MQDRSSKSVGMTEMVVPISGSKYGTAYDVKRVSELQNLNLGFWMRFSLSLDVSYQCLTRFYSKVVRYPEQLFYLLHECCYKGSQVSNNKNILNKIPALQGLGLDDQLYNSVIPIQLQGVLL